MAFVDSIRALPFAGRTQMGGGFLAPMVRAMGHLLFLLGCIADEDTPVTDEAAINELTHARDHWNARAISEAVSTPVRERAVTIGTAINEAIAEWAGWDQQARETNLRDLNHRILQYAADLDRELVGLRDSDPGTTL
jgi:hypothetical protein